MTLMRGGCVCIPSDADRLNNLAESIRNFNANAVLLTPTVVRLLSPSDVPCLTTLISGGEKVTQDIVGLWADKLDLIIAYGPAESTIACIGKKARPAGDDAVRIGFPVNSRAWVARLDDPNQLAPVGAIGELVAEGPGSHGVTSVMNRAMQSYSSTLRRGQKSGSRAWPQWDGAIELVTWFDTPTTANLFSSVDVTARSNFVAKGSSLRTSRLN